MTESPEIPAYSTGGQIAFWFLWLLGLGVCLLFILFALII